MLESLPSLMQIGQIAGLILLVLLGAITIYYVGGIILSLFISVLLIAGALVVGVCIALYFAFVCVVTFLAWVFTLGRCKLTNLKGSAGSTGDRLRSLGKHLSRRK